MQFENYVFMLLPGLNVIRGICERFVMRHVEPQTTLFTELSAVLYSSLIIAVRFPFSNPP